MDNMDRPVVQWLRAKDIIRRRTKLNAPQFAVAHFSDISEPLLSLVESGRKMLSHEAQNSIALTLRFFEHLAEQHAPTPVDFSNIEALEPLFKQFKKDSSAKEVVRTSKE